MAAPHPRPYLRDGVPGLPIEAQEAAFREAGIDLSTAYRDELPKAQRKRRDPADLKERATLLKPTARKTPEVIHVASLIVLGWSMADIAQALAAAGRRNASVHALDTDETFKASTLTEATGLLEALADAEAGRRRAQTKDARSAGVTAAAAARAKRRESRLAEARKLWILPEGEISVADIAERVKLSPKTLYNYLGTREAAREAAENPRRRKK